MMTRRLLALVAGALLAIPLLSQAAGAQTCVPSQYVACATTTTTSSTTTSTSSTSTSTTSTTVQATTTTDAPPPQAIPAKTSNPTPKPGESVPISSPASSGTTPVLDNTKPTAGALVPANGGPDIALPAPVITKNANGSISVSITVPPSTPPGVYLITIIGTTPSGQTRAIIVPIVVRRTTVAKAQSVPFASASGPPAVVPESVRQIVASIVAAGGEAAVEDAVLHDGAELRFDGARLVLYRPGEDTNDDSRPLVAAFAVALAGGGLVLLRRRTPSISKRSN